MRPEARFREWFKNAIHPLWRVNNIETSTMSGFPDILLEIPHVGDIPIELKVNKPRLNKYQYAWITKRMGMDLPVAVLSKIKNEYHIWYKHFEVQVTKDRLTIITEPDDKHQIIESLQECLMKIILMKHQLSQDSLMQQMNKSC